MKPAPAGREGGGMAMKYGFSTAGCPDWLWKEVVSTAKDLGYDGIEIRGLANKSYLPSTRTFSWENCHQIRLQMEELRLEIPCLSSTAPIFDRKRQEAAQAEIRDYIHLAALLGVPYVRVQPDEHDEPGNPPDDEALRENLREISGLAEDKDVVILVETGGAYAASRKMAALIEGLGDPNIGVLWDVHNTFRFFGETPIQTWDRLKDWVFHAHVKDSQMENGKIQHKMFGYGDVPLRAALGLLQGEGFDGYIVLEWTKTWAADLEDPGVVLAHFPFAVRRMLKASAAQVKRI